MKFCPACKQHKDQSLFAKNKVAEDGLYSSCKECDNKRNAKQKSELVPFVKKMYNKIKNKDAQIKRLNKKQSEQLEPGRHECRITWEEFLNKFMDQYRAIGLTCPIKGFEMTHFHGKGKLPTNISVDRLDNDLPYTYENIIFMSLMANRAKSSLRIPDVIALNFWIQTLMPHKYYGYSKSHDDHLIKLREELQIRRKINEMEQALSVSEKHTGDDWEQTSLFDQGHETPIRDDNPKRNTKH